MSNAEESLRLQAAVLEMIARGEALQPCLDQLCRLVSEIVEGSIPSIMLLDERGEALYVESAPGVGEELIDLLNGLVPSDLAGSCGTAVYQRQPVFVTDSSCDPRWQDMQQLVKRFGIHACWSVPVFSRTGGVLGSFAISHGSRQEPDQFHKELLITASHLAGIALDRDAEMRRVASSENALRVSQKLESLGVLASGIAHDFNNLLVGIQGNAELALLCADNPDEFREALDRVVMASESAADLTRQLLSYTGRGQVKVEPLSLNECAESLAKIVKSTARGQLTVESSSDEPAILGDRTQIQQVVLNMITNAIDATTANQGHVHITTGVVNATAKDLESWIGGSALDPGPFGYIEVQDSGAGMDAATLEKIFDPFFTTKATGSGLGLAATLGIISANRGCLMVTSEPGEGTRFRMLCPLTTGDFETTGCAAARTELSEPLDGARILIVDDDEMVLRVTSQMLEHMKAEVRTATSGALALRELEAGSSFDLIVLDLNMPEVSGQATYLEIRKEHPDLPVIFCSGQSAGECSELMAVDATTSFLPKPFGPESIRAVLTEALQTIAAGK